MSTTISEQTAALLEAAGKHLPADVVQAFADDRATLLAQPAPSGPRVGAKLPDVSLVDATGKSVSLGEVVTGAPAVIFFYRGAWCPYCNVVLRTYQSELLPALRSLGTALVAISPQSPDASLATAEKAELEYTVLSDARSEVASRLGIAFDQSEQALGARRKLGLDLRTVNVDGSTTLPMPTVLVTDAAGVVRFVDVHAGYTTRTEVADILAAVQAL